MEALKHYYNIKDP